MMDGKPNGIDVPCTTFDSACMCNVRQMPQRQDSVSEQLLDVYAVAVRLGCYDAADWLIRHARITPAERD